MLNALVVERRGRRRIAAGDMIVIVIRRAILTSPGQFFASSIDIAIAFAAGDDEQGAADAQ